MAQLGGSEWSLKGSLILYYGHTPRAQPPSLHSVSELTISRVYSGENGRLDDTSMQFGGTGG